MASTGLQLDVSDGRPSEIDLSSIQNTLSELGICVWPLDHTKVPDELRALIRQPALTNEERDRLLTHFLLPHERLLEIIENK